MRSGQTVTQLPTAPLAAPPGSAPSAKRPASRAASAGGLHGSCSLPKPGTAPPALSKNLSVATVDLGGIIGLNSPDFSSAAAATGVATGAAGSGGGFRRSKSGSQSYHCPFEVAYQRVAMQRNLRKLADLFEEADVDRSKMLSLVEFREALRKPRVQRTFSTLGVQPHQSELVFKSMTEEENSEITIQQFMRGLTNLVGADVDGTGKELNISMLRPTREAKEMRSSIAERWRQAGPLEPGSRAPKQQQQQQQQQQHQQQQQQQQQQQVAQQITPGQVNLLPEKTIQRAFIASARAQALHPALAMKQPVHRIAQ